MFERDDMNRVDKIKKSVFKSVLSSLLYVIVIIAVSGYFAYNLLFPVEATPQNVKDGSYYSFTGIKAENRYKDEKSGYIYVTLINEKNEVMDVCVDTEKRADEVMKASKDKPFTFKGQSYIQEHDYRQTMYELYKDKKISYLHPFGLLDYRVGWGFRDFIVPIGVLIALIVNIVPIFTSFRCKREALEILDKNPIYIDRDATVQIHKYLDIVNEYIILMSSTPAIINIKESSEIVLTRHRSYLITTHFSLSFLDGQGKRRNYKVPKLKKEKAQELLDYINNVGKKVVSGL